MNEQPKWYILHTYSGYEAMVKDSLEKLIENNNLQENIFESDNFHFQSSKLPYSKVF